MRRRRVTGAATLGLAFVAVLAGARHAAAEGHASAIDGAAFYAAQCVDCHGPAGEGSDYHSVPLTGDLPVSELARLIADTMPEGDPEACVGAEAEAVARHVYEAFYSPLAQARIRPPRRELSRLTVRQFEQSLADVLGEFRWRKPWGDERGLSLRFVELRNVAASNEQNLRGAGPLDLTLSEHPELPDSLRDKAFYTKQREAEAAEEPDSDEKAKAEKAIRVDVRMIARGRLLVPRTGDYDLIVRSPNGFELSLNGGLLIDAKVRSSNEESVVETVRLIGGRAYPLRIVATRTSEPDLRFALAWRRPGGVEEVIPARFLSPENGPPVFATTVRFPPDDRSVGYVRGAAVSPEWLDAVTRAALEATGAILTDLPRFAGVEGDEEPTLDQAVAFCERLAETAFRRPLSEDERSRYVGERFAIASIEPVPGQSAEGSPDGDAASPSAATPAPVAAILGAVEQSSLAILTSPNFLYPEAAQATAEAGLPRDHAVASRLALALWDSIPDRTLRKQAAAEKLNNPEQVRRQARRMLGNLRTRSKLAGFFESWLRLDHVARLSRDPEAFPDFDDRVAHDMRASLDLLLDDVVWRGDGDLRRLFLTEDLYVNRRLADFLSVSAELRDDPEEFVKASVDTRKRSGVVSHPFMVTALSYFRETSPIHRGVFLARHVLGRSLRPPPEAVAPLPPDLAPELTTRERVALQTSPGQCQACHVLINDLGFTLEEFDAVGRFRERDTGKPVDPTGGYVATDGRRAAFRGARELAEFLAGEEDVHRSFVVQLFEHVTKQPMLAYGADTQQSLLQGFRESGYNIRELLVEIATVAALAEEAPIAANR